MKFSIIIPTRNRRKSLQKLLFAIGEQTYDEHFEIIVNDQSDEKTTFQPPAKGEFRYLPDDKRGSSQSRNNAIRKARGDYLVLLDDDADIKPSCLADLDRVIDLYPDHACLCGLIRNIEDNKPFSRYAHANRRAKAVGFGNFDCCLGSAMVVKRRIALELGLLDESLGTGTHFGGSEETDLILRLLEAEHKVAYDSDYVTLHPRTSPKAMSSKAWLRKHYHYGLGRGALLRKHFRMKPAWALAQLLRSVSMPLGGSIGSLISLRPHQVGRYLVSAAGRIVGFVSYRGGNEN